MASGNFNELVTVFFVAVAVVSLIRKVFNLPPVVGYILTGVIIAPNTGYGLVSSIDGLQKLDQLAHLGVTFLLFTIGLELSLKKLISMRRALLGLGGMQVLLCSGITIAICKYLGLSSAGSVAIAGAITLSSTAVVTRQLIEQGEMQNIIGRTVLSILLFQDLAAVPFLIIVPALAKGGGGNIGNELLTLTLTGAIIFLAMLAAGRLLMRPLFHQAAGARSSELFMITALFVALASGWITEHLGLSMELGAFLAGVMLAETEYAHQIESDIKPFRDILLGLFFIGVGLKIDPFSVIKNWYAVFGIVSALLIVKAGIITMLAKVIGKTNFRTSIRAGLALAQGGEFGFALLSSNVGVLSPMHNQLIISSTVISIAIAPVIIKYSGNIADMLISDSKKIPSNDNTNILKNNNSTEDLSGHVIICGFGHVGQTLAKFLEQDAIPFIGLEVDPQKIAEASAAGEPIFYGDASNAEVLQKAGVSKAKLLVITFDNHMTSRKVLQLARKSNKKLLSLVSTRDDSYLTSLQQAGATEVIPEKLEVSLMLASHILMFLGHAPAKVQQQIQDVRNYRYNMLKSYFHGADDASDPTKDDQNVLHAIKLTEKSYALDKTLEEITTNNIDVKFNITSFYRNGFKCNDVPSPNTILKLGDVIVVQGTKEEIYAAEEALIEGKS